MNPDYYKTYEKATYDHEMKRVKSMLDEELETRYGKMTKQDKIGAFYEALTDADRSPKLRKKMEGNWGIPVQTKKGECYMQFVKVVNDISDGVSILRQAIFTWENRNFLYSYSMKNDGYPVDETMVFRCDEQGDHDGRELFHASGYIHSTDAMNNTVAYLESETD
tara:strand:- start:1090 stop:1584 length:495 start_codon:yes stop_codon:yes gene_type:complete